MNSRYLHMNLTHPGFIAGYESVERQYPMNKPKTYSAIFVTGTPGKLIYQHRPEGNLIGELPLGARAKVQTDGEVNTLYRTDDGDPFECARFIVPSGREIEIKLD